MRRIGPVDWQHSHDYAVDCSAAERRTHVVIGITATIMLIEIAAGMAFGSMALLADGWHMSTHVAAFLITALAYHFGRRHATDPRYSLGTGKFAAIVGIAAHDPKPAESCRDLLQQHEELVHLTVEVRRSNAREARAGSGDQ